MKTFEPKIISSLRNYSSEKLVNDLVAGLIVAIIALPLSIALAIASGVSPELGLHTAIIAGFVIALFGGSSVNISGPTAAFATIVAGIVASYGLSGLITATILAGIMLILMGLCQFGVLIKYIPMSITTGFTSGIAVTIVVGQIKDFLGLSFAPGTHAVETMEKLEAIAASIGTLDVQALLVGLLGLGIITGWTMLAKRSKGVISRIPPAIVAVVLGILLVEFTSVEVNTIGTLYPELSAEFPRPSLPAFDLETIRSVLPSAFTIAMLAAIESLLSCVVSDEMIHDRHNPNTELIAQGLGNVCSGIFGGIPATGAIARTAANVKNGGRSPVAGIVHALILLLCLLVLMPLAKMIPMPIIAAILFVVAYNMSEWRHFVHICRSAPRSDIIVLVITFVLTVVFDLVVAIGFGLVLTAILFIKDISDVTYVRRWKNDGAPTGQACRVPGGTLVYEIHGPMFFANSEKFLGLPLEEDTKVLIVRMSDVPAIDASGVKSLETLLQDCRNKNITLLISHANEQPLAAIMKSGLYHELGAKNFLPNIDYALERAAKLCGK